MPKRPITQLIDELDLGTVLGIRVQMDGKAYAVEQKFWVGVTRDNLDLIPERFRATALKATEKHERRAAKRLGNP